MTFGGTIGATDSTLFHLFLYLLLRQTSSHRACSGATWVEIFGIKNCIKAKVSLWYCSSNMLENSQLSFQLSSGDFHGFPGHGWFVTPAASLSSGHHPKIESWWPKMRRGTSGGPKFLQNDG